MNDLELLVYDSTCRGRGPLPGLSHAWGIGAGLYRGLGRIQSSRGVQSWGEALNWLATTGEDQPISGIQFWGHGKWGTALVDRDVFDERALIRGHPLHPALTQVRERLNPESLMWFRTCETFGAHRGARFARSLADFLGCRVAGHTYIIGDWQSGLHTLEPGHLPTWSPEEGLAEGDARAPERARWSTPFEPNTIHCLRGAIPPGF